MQFVLFFVVEMVDRFY